jgi:hypothetical protein
MERTYLPLLPFESFRYDIFIVDRKENRHEVGGLYSYT